MLRPVSLARSVPSATVSRAARRLLALTLAAGLAVACDSGAETGGDDHTGGKDPVGGDDTGSPHEPSAPDAAAPAPATATFPRFDVAPRDGDYWLFEVTDTWHGEATVTYSMLTLSGGAATTIGGIGAQAFAARWDYYVNHGGKLYVDPDRERWSTDLAFGQGRIFGKRDGGWGVYFDAFSGAWPSAGGLFDHYRAGPMYAERATYGGRSVYSVTQGGGNDCVTLPGYGTVCGDSDPNQAYQTTEYYDDELGPFGMTFLGCSSGGCIDTRYELVAWRVGASANEISADAWGGSGGGSTTSGPADLADLAVGDAYVGLWPVQPDGYAYVCFNVDLQGATTADRHFVSVDNIGRSQAPESDVIFWIETADRQHYAVGEQVAMTPAVPAGKRIDIEPVGCIAIPTHGLPAGDYYLRLMVDAYEVVAEADESNNFGTFPRAIEVR